MGVRSLQSGVFSLLARQFLSVSPTTPQELDHTPYPAKLKSLPAPRLRMDIVLRRPFPLHAHHPSPPCWAPECVNQDDDFRKNTLLFGLT